MTIITDTYGQQHELPGPYLSIAEIKRANSECGNFWFTPDTMKFFDSKIEPKVYEGRIFISSEQFRGERPEDDGPRQWSLRVCADSGRVNTLVDTKFDSLDAAENAVVDLVRKAEA